MSGEIYPGWKTVDNGSLRVVDTIEIFDGREFPIVECPVCEETFQGSGISRHWASKHDEVHRPWWPSPTETKRNGVRWAWARRQALDRDEHECQRCGAGESEGSRLEVHHIIPFIDFDVPGEAHELSNLITLCPACHGAVEGLTIEELEENINDYRGDIT